MEDVARAAGLSRQTVYKLFLGRRELVEAAAAERIVEIADSIAAEQVGDSVSSDSFVAASVEVIETLRDDPEIALLTGADSPINFHDAVWLDAVVKRAREFWRPWLTRSRSVGALREDINDDDLSDWLQIVYSSLILMREQRPANDRAVIERFVLTSLTLVTAER